ncbi:hypothetical protein AUEXF2481DRAFT_28633 [Aureobasidium subglaciale EXF-2481]|uniref:BZIP domain-containing protein n=1 Tax=Aureobasidium subglaciale (strain EXF-2481) TaxID=1043005 RepID=A0A074YIJ1_AURSE|nr:uncharacterized protein AUEXF2481DRAFT_28633 [Aureobasidium subglaciale EXF-2481]KAI5211062.1 hypothetical protein E4T38_01530 [Aureobasidium subglaciale]KAI5219055.1 hypothetical protein E4T40_06618 [Aureobasidium subglaciale]KAI5233085.1 hypothetical protein E4T41_01528 [Aureobasidium subglaciale]KAI5260044.1 hypothetical protein E4T46_06418 [Aureobasidium subglaciale]KEQ95909.1 hypothetical protein AUEXF2481DRAFT_28633 [Aureobasidium subglaciale EXF-2481]
MRDLTNAVEESETPPNVASSRRSRVRSNLSEEQLRRKRNVDRRAQQAFRQRNKDHTNRLQEELDQLRTKWRSREHELLQDIQQLHEQNHVLVRRLQDVASLATSTGATVDLSRLSGEAVAIQRLSDDHSTQSTSRNAASESVEHRTASPLDDDLIIQEAGPPTITGITNPSILQEPVPASDFGRDTSPQVAETHFTSSRVDQAFSLRGSPEVSPSALAHQSPNEAVYTSLPLHMSPTCPLDHILLGFLTSNRTMHSNGTSSELLAGPEKASVRGFVHRNSDLSSHPISKVMCEIMSTYPSVGRAEQLGLFYLMHQTMRWLVVPVRPSYMSMPSWLRPTVTQITVPHPAWIDNVPWPEVRDKIIMCPHRYPYELWTANFTQTVKVGWPYEITDAWVERNGDYVLHSIFEKHVRRLENWSVSPQFGQAFPDLMPIMLREQ